VLFGGGLGGAGGSEELGKPLGGKRHQPTPFSSGEYIAIESKNCPSDFEHQEGKREGASARGSRGGGGDTMNCSSVQRTLYYKLLARTWAKASKTKEFLQIKEIKKTGVTSAELPSISLSPPKRARSLARPRLTDREGTACPPKKLVTRAAAHRVVRCNHAKRGRTKTQRGGGGETD